MNILYGVQGTGNGHISRSREIMRHLKARGHHVEVMISGRDPETFWDMEDFEPYIAYEGLTPTLNFPSARICLNTSELTTSRPKAAMNKTP